VGAAAVAGMGPAVAACASDGDGGAWRLPCVGAASVPKVAGLAKPLHGNCIPQGLTAEQFDVLSSIVRSRVGDISDDIVVQGSRVTGTAKPT
jgi:hypothetical protein